MSSDRLEKLKAMLDRQPDDAFLLYGMAMEYRKLNQSAKAVEFLDRVLAIEPNYSYAYHQKGLIHESTGHLTEAREAYQAGIDAARRSGDAHAGEEIAAALSMIE